MNNNTATSAGEKEVPPELGLVPNFHCPLTEGLLDHYHCYYSHPNSKRLQGSTPQHSNNWLIKTGNRWIRSDPFQKIINPFRKTITAPGIAWSSFVLQKQNK